MNASERLEVDGDGIVEQHLQPEVCIVGIHATLAIVKSTAATQYFGARDSCARRHVGQQCSYQLRTCVGRQAHYAILQSTRAPHVFTRHTRWMLEISGGDCRHACTVLVESSNAL